MIRTTFAMLVTPSVMARAHAQAVSTHDHEGCVNAGKLGRLSRLLAAPAESGGRNQHD
ncbi:hypothetical protein [Methylobacterium sp. UNCCL125]|uniref:hypothetical protein n=2 Tax=unclassified Methylobacterium TaxID=2615210 RepID=UPI00147A779C|nr:hypothetical protein [Methylobacterium sp. UNCCL125]